MFLRNGQALGSVLHSAEPGAKPVKAKAEPEVEGSTGEVLDDVAPEVVEPQPESEPAPKKAPAKKAAPAFKSVLDDED